MNVAAETLIHPEAHIRVVDVTMAYGEFVIQRDINFTINRGDIFIIMGGSGSGKSTILKALIGLKAPATGDVFFNGVNYWKSSADEQIRLLTIKSEERRVLAHIITKAKETG